MEIWDFLTDSLMLECRNSANISAFSLITLVGTSVSWHVLDVSRFKIPLRISSLYNSENEKGLAEFSLHTFPKVSTLGCGSVIFSELELLSVSGILRLITMLEKKELKDWAKSLSFEKTLSFLSM